MIETELVSILSGHSGVSGLIGTRLYPVVIPQDKTLPAVAYQKISATRVHTLAGPTNLAHPRVQLTCWALTYAEAKQVIEQVRAALYGAWPGAIIMDLPDRYESDTRRFGVAVDVRVLHLEPGT